MYLDSVALLFLHCVTHLLINSVALLLLDGPALKRRKCYLRNLH